MEPLKVELVNVPAGTILRLSGELGLRMDNVEIAFNRLAAQRPPIAVIDLTKLAFISSLGMGLLVRLRQGLAPHRGVVRIAGASQQVADSLRRARLLDLFQLYATADDALAAGPPTPPGTRRE
jgi:anti-anti-sigma factor